MKHVEPSLPKAGFSLARQVRLPDQNPQKPPEVPEVDLPEDELWRRPEMPPPPPPPWSEDWVALKDGPRVVAM